MSCCSRSALGQATVEAAFLIPTLFLVLGLLCQPAILLYDRCVMQTAAAEGCRAAAAADATSSKVRAYVLRRLGAVPHLEAFHCGGRDGWQISCSGGETSGRVRVEIVNEARPLPLFGIAAGLVSQIGPSGLIRQEVSCDLPGHAAWVSQLGSSPDDWIGTWK